MLLLGPSSRRGCPPRPPAPLSLLTIGSLMTAQMVMPCLTPGVPQHRSRRRLQPTDQRTPRTRTPRLQPQPRPQQTPCSSCSTPLFLGERSLCVVDTPHVGSSAHRVGAAGGAPRKRWAGKVANGGGVISGQRAAQSGQLANQPAAASSSSEGSHTTTRLEGLCPPTLVNDQLAKLSLQLVVVA